MDSAPAPAQVKVELLPLGVFIVDGTDFGKVSGPSVSLPAVQAPNDPRVHLPTAVHRLAGERPLIYVADSTLLTADNLDALAEARIDFISRLPERYGLA